jgi:hypothetical protein
MATTFSLGTYRPATNTQTPSYPAGSAAGGISSVGRYRTTLPQAVQAQQVAAPTMNRLSTVQAQRTGMPNGAREVFWDDALNPAQVQAPTLGAARHVDAGQFQVDPNGFQVDAGQFQVDPNGFQVGADALAPTQWGGVDPSQLGVSGISEEMQRQALRELQLGGRLSADEQRLATQTARQGFSARGMGLSNAAVFAEALNRSQFATQRQADRRAFAGGVEEQDMARRLANQQATNQGQIVNAQGRLSADTANMGASLSRLQGNQAAGMQGALANQQTGMQGALANQAAGMQGALANQQTGMQGALANQQAGNQFALAQAEMGLQGALANQGALNQFALTNAQGRFSASQANQGADLQTDAARLQAQQFNANQNLQAQQSNQQAGYQQQMANMGASQWAQQLNANNALAAGQFNQQAMQQGLQFNANAGLQAALANQQTQLGQYGIDRNIGQQQWDWQANSAENARINQANQAMLNQLYGGGGVGDYSYSAPRYSWGG